MEISVARRVMTLLCPQWFYEACPCLWIWSMGHYKCKASRKFKNTYTLLFACFYNFLESQFDHMMKLKLFGNPHGVKRTQSNCGLLDQLIYQLTELWLRLLLDHGPSCAAGWPKRLANSVQNRRTSNPNTHNHKK
jgi:hypothetical protein